MRLQDKASIIWPKGAPSKAGFVALWNPQTGELVNFPITRATTKKYIDDTGEWAEAAANVLPRDFTNGGCGVWAIEPARKNLFLNSTTGVTQTITVVSGRDYAVSFSGTGSITFSGGATGTLSGTGAGATDRVSIIKTTTTTSVTCTISGTVEYVNFEINTNDSSVAYATRWIETAGSIVTRNADVPALTGAGALLGDTTGGIFAEWRVFKNNNDIKYFEISNGTTTNRTYIYYRDSTGSSPRVFFDSVVGGISQVEVYDIPSGRGEDFHKVLLRYSLNNMGGHYNGVTAISSSSWNVASEGTYSQINFATSSGAIPFYGEIRQLIIFNQSPDNTQGNALTTP